MKKKIALITGINGQDGSYLTEFLLSKGYKVYGVIRRTSSHNKERLQHILKHNHPDLTLYYGDVTDSSCISSILKKSNPDEVYHLAAQSHVQISFEIPEYSANVDAIGTLVILEAIRSFNPKIKIYNAATSELYGDTCESMQNETTTFNPQSPYAVSKLFSFYMCKVYREAYGMFICNGILYNHESERREDKFISRKITSGIAKGEKLILGNLDSKRDWGYSPEYVKSMWVMLQQKKPDDYVIATGETHTVREFVEVAYKEIGMDIKWICKGLKEKGVDKKTNKVLVEISKNYMRPLDVKYLCGDYSKAKRILGWEPKTKFKDLIKIMLKHDLEEYGRNNSRID